MSFIIYLQFVVWVDPLDGTAEYTAGNMKKTAYDRKTC